MLNLIRAVLGIHHHRFNLSVKCSRWMWVTANGAGAPNSASDDRCYPHPLRTVLAATSLYRLLLPSKLRVKKMRDQLNVAVELNLVFGVASQEINLLTEKIRSH